MKQLLMLMALMFSYMLAEAQATTLVVDNQTPGWLSSKINYGDQQTVENLTITGYVNQIDLDFIGTLMSKHALHGRLNLTNVNIVDTKYSEKLTSVGVQMFPLSWLSTVNLQRFSLPKSLPAISPYLLAGIQVDTLDYGSEKCHTLQEFLVTNRNNGTNRCPQVLILREGVTKLEAFGTDEGEEYALKTVILPATVDSICERAFYNARNLHDINLHDNISLIDQFAFANSSYLPDTLYLPLKLKTFYLNAYPKKKGQVRVVPNAVELIDNRSTSKYYDNDGLINPSKDEFVFVINRIKPPKFLTRYGSNYDLSSSTLYVPREGLSYYTSSGYDTSTYGSGGNPYSQAKEIVPISVSVESIILNITSCSLNVGNTIILTADVQPQNADNRDIIWTSTNSDVAYIDNNGKISALSSGTTIVKASSAYNPEIYALCEITVKQPLESIILNPSSLSLKAGETYVDFTLQFLPPFADNKNVIWTSSNASIATVDSDGKITTFQGGEVVITATSAENPNIKAECILTVIQPVIGIECSPTEFEITEGNSKQIIANVMPENASNKSITWTSSDIRIAMVSSDGTVFGIKPGQATIMATSVDGGFVALCKVTVKTKTIFATSLSLSAEKSNLTIGESMQIIANVSPENTTNKNVTWRSSDNSVAEVSMNGIVTGLSEGSAQIVATTSDGTNISAVYQLTVNKSKIQISSLSFDHDTYDLCVGDLIRLCPKITPMDATDTRLSWSSTNNAVATVDNNGNVLAKTEGDAQIICFTKDGSNLCAICKIIVRDKPILVTSIMLDKKVYEGKEGESLQLFATVLPSDATNPIVDWSSTDDTILSVDNNGNVHLKKQGTAIVSAASTDGSNVKDECQITVGANLGLNAIFTDETSIVKVYTLTGYLIFEGQYSELKLKEGLYIVIIDGRPFKVKL